MSILLRCPRGVALTRTGRDARATSGPGLTRPVHCPSSVQENATTAPDVRKLAGMAQIAVTDEEVKDWQPKINGIIDWFGELGAVDVSGVEPAVHMSTAGNFLRKDLEKEFELRSELLSAAPETEKSYVRVPRVVSSADSSTSSSTATATPSSSSSHGTAEPEPIDFMSAVHALDIRVGRILECEQHPDAESLYVEKIDVGEPEPRTIVSGLVKFVPLKQMKDRYVIVICNLKPRNMRGVKSSGMVMAASDTDKTTVQPIMPPAGAKVGERVWFGEDRSQPEPAVPNTVEKKKLWEVVQPLLQTGAGFEVRLAGLEMNTSAGPVRSESLANARVA